MSESTMLKEQAPDVLVVCRVVEIESREITERRSMSVRVCCRVMRVRDIDSGMEISGMPVPEGIECGDLVRIAINRLSWF